MSPQTVTGALTLYTFDSFTKISLALYNFLPYHIKFIYLTQELFKFALIVQYIPLLINLLSFFIKIKIAHI